MTFSDELWHGITDIYEAILRHPFIAGLTDGSLPGDAFAFYVIQDALYLRQYAAALAAVASRAPHPAQTEMFARHAAQAISVEQQLHRSLLADLGIDPASATKAEPAPANLAYTSYLLATTGFGSYAEGVGAVLPCYWIYWEVGKELLRRGSPDPRYQRWIGTYGGEEFGATVREVLLVTDELGAGLAAAERDRVHCHFRTTSRYEWMFWDMGYHKESWPVLESSRKKSFEGTCRNDSFECNVSKHEFRRDSRRVRHHRRAGQVQPHRPQGDARAGPPGADGAA